MLIICVQTHTYTHIYTHIYTNNYNSNFKTYTYKNIFKKATYSFATQRKSKLTFHCIFFQFLSV